MNKKDFRKVGAGITSYYAVVGLLATVAVIMSIVVMIARAFISGTPVSWEVITYVFCLALFLGIISHILFRVAKDN